MQKTYPIIDICKFFCALLVIFIHTFQIRTGHFAGNAIYECLCQQAVPFFFLASGFLIGNRINDRQYIMRYVSRLLCIYIIWVLLWSPTLIHSYAQMYPNLIQLIFVLVRRVFFAGYGVYWYILVLVESVLIIHLLTNHRKVLYFLATGGMFLYYLYALKAVSIVNTVFYFIFSWSNNFIMMGVPFVLIGNELGISGQYHHLNKTYIVASYAAVTLIDFVVYTFCGCGVLFPLQAVLLLLISIQKYSISFNTKILREASSTFYYTHTFFIYKIIDRLMPINGNLSLRYLFTVCCCICCFAVLKAINNKWLNKLVSI